MFYSTVHRTSPGTLARELIERGSGCTLQLEVQRRVRLEGAELDEYHRREREVKETTKKKRGCVLLIVY